MARQSHASRMIRVNGYTDCNSTTEKSSNTPQQNVVTSSVPCTTTGRASSIIMMMLDENGRVLEGALLTSTDKAKSVDF